jgi:hypothetical protein
MKGFMIAMAIIAATAAITTPARAETRLPWCAQVYRGGDSDCMYYTYAQCLASVSGRSADCIRNPLYIATPTTQSRRYRSY